MTARGAAPKPKATPKSKAIYQLKITLRGSKPPIWRRVQVPGSLTLDALHIVIQIAMGWDDGHLHEFVVGDATYSPPNVDLGDPFSPNHSETRAHLYKIAPQVGSRLTYIYDFGDDWTHAILVEKILDPEPDARYPRCVAGRMACPPEDCGGIWRYYYLLDALADPKHPDHDDLEEWMGGAFDPTAFSLDEVNAQFEQIGDIADLAKVRRQNSLLSVESILLEPSDAQDSLSDEPWPDVRELAGLLDMHGAAPKPRAISLDHLGYAFTTPPLLIGGRAMEWYGLRSAGADIDFVVTRADYDGLVALHPEHLKDLRGDLGVVVEPFELWTSIYRFDYDALAVGAQDIGAYRIISQEKLLLLKCLGINEEKNALDVLLICNRILDQQYGKA